MISSCRCSRVRIFGFNRIKLDDYIIPQGIQEFVFDYEFVFPTPPRPDAITQDTCLLSRRPNLPYISNKHSFHRWDHQRLLAVILIMMITVIKKRLCILESIQGNKHPLVFITCSSPKKLNIYLWLLIQTGSVFDGKSSSINEAQSGRRGHLVSYNNLVQIQVRPGISWTDLESNM